jgi:hypothetical protein
MYYLFRIKCARILHLRFYYLVESLLVKQQVKMNRTINKKLYISNIMLQI